MNTDRKRRKDRDLQDLPEKAKRFLEKYPGIVAACRTLHLKESRESSVSCSTGEDHVIYFQPFMEEAMILEGKVEILTTHWAQAFLQFPLSKIAEVLCCAIFSRVDLIQRDKVDRVDQLPSIKRVAILRAAKWMLTKNQNPWSYEPTEWPNKEETVIIESTFQTFKSVYHEDQYVSLPTILKVDRSNAISSESSNSKVQQGSVTMVTETNDSPTVNPFDPSSVDDAMEKTFRQLDYSKTFTRIIQLDKLGLIPSLGNYAQTVQALTKLTIPHNTDYFVDAVQFSAKRWKAAKLCGTSIEKCAVKLFGKYWRLHCLNSGGQLFNFEDVCPVKRLAIYRFLAKPEKMGHPIFTKTFLHRCINPHIHAHAVYRFLPYFPLVPQSF
ncbi:uncharacterized protein LOC110854859 isoform X4 [Folsomia candida]|uniref:uncharacterized protein LOC110854859 isoform X4 n=1 Tax=Folsomia candida TaxID=158441 RepID=UPI0016050E3B|nr:uncharacterized protein LOC110854859 isoform X4 [Folsomia candida]